MDLPLPKHVRFAHWVTSNITTEWLLGAGIYSGGVWMAWCWFSFSFLLPTGVLLAFMAGLGLLVLWASSLMDDCVPTEWLQRHRGHAEVRDLILEQSVPVNWKRLIEAWESKWQVLWRQRRIERQMAALEAQHSAVR